MLDPWHVVDGSGLQCGILLAVRIVGRENPQAGGCAPRGAVVPQNFRGQTSAYVSRQGAACSPDASRNLGIRVVVVELDVAIRSQAAFLQFLSMLFRDVLHGDIGVREDLLAASVMSTRITRDTL